MFVRCDSDDSGHLEKCRKSKYYSYNDVYTMRLKAMVITVKNVQLHEIHI